MIIIIILINQRPHVQREYLGLYVGSNGPSGETPLGRSVGQQRRNRLDLALMQDRVSLLPCDRWQLCVGSLRVELLKRSHNFANNLAALKRDAAVTRARRFVVAAQD